MFGDVKEDKCVSDVVEFLSRGKSPQYIEKSKVKVLNQACIYWDEIKYEKVKFQDSSKVNPMAILHSNDLIITSTGTGTLGRCNIFIQPDKYTYTADSHLTMVRLKKNLINELYLKTFFSLDSTQKDLYRSCVNGSTNQIELSKDKLLKFKIKTPKIEHQLEYFNLVQQLDKSKFRIKKSLEKLEMTYKALLQEYFG